ncbi:MAG: NAD(P)/FAD-dependent oxidoreductase [Flavobacteriales bacterium]
MNIPRLDLPRVVVIGSGFAGLKLIKGIDQRLYQTVLIDKNNYHTFQPLMYQVASAGLEADSIAYPVRKIFKNKKNFHFRMAEVLRIETSKKVISTSIGDLEYDVLVVATGANSNFFGMENVAKHSMPMKSLVESLNLRSRILQCFEQALNITDLKEQEAYMNFVIVGGGPTGVELAGALAELKKQVLPKDYPDLDIRRMQIHIIEAADRLLASMTESSSRRTTSFLKSMNVNVWLNTAVKDYDGTLVTTNKQTFHSKTLVWAAGVSGTAPEGMHDHMTRQHRIICGEHNEVKGLEDVYAIGDISVIPSDANPNGHPMLASVAGQQGSALANNLNRKLKGKSMKPFNYTDKGTMATIGRNLAVVDLPFISFGGILAWLTWMFVHLMLLVDYRSRVVVFINWAWSYINFDKGIRLIVRKERMSN